MWTTGLRLTYRCELRSEGPETSARLFDAAPDYYAAITHEALKDTSLPTATAPEEDTARYRQTVSPAARSFNRLAWRLRQVQGKGLSALRLLKGLLTFKNGLDYVLWKIERHSGTRIEVSPTLRRFPPLAVLVTFWRLFREGAFR